MSLSLAAANNAGSVTSEKHLAVARMYRQHQWFQLREQVGHSDLFYQGAVAAAFDQREDCLLRFQHIFEHRPQSAAAYEAHKLLAWMYLRHGNYDRALNQAQAMAALQPGNMAILSGIQLYSLLAGYPPQVIGEKQLSEVPTSRVDGNLFIPVSINGVSCHAMPDTGATMSLITRTEARRAGMSVRPLPKGSLQIYSATGDQSAAAVATADELLVGNFRIKHPVFLVLDDWQLQFPPQYRIALGLPVILGLQSLRWEPLRDKLTFGSPSASPRPHSTNLCFDAADLIASVEVEQQAINLLIDTGSGSTMLWPPFAQRFQGLLSRSSKGMSIVHGIGGTASREHAELAELTLRLGGHQLYLRPAHVITGTTTPNSAWLFGRMGLDALGQCQSVTIDFRAMTLTFDPRPA
jgi:predicted aspartyl protease